MKTETRTYGVKLTTGEIILVKAWSHDAAKVTVWNKKPHTDIDSVWAVGGFWDAKGQPYNYSNEAWYRK